MDLYGQKSIPQFISISLWDAGQDSTYTCIAHGTRSPSTLLSGQFLKLLPLSYLHDTFQFPEAPLFGLLARKEGLCFSTLPCTSYSVPRSKAKKWAHRERVICSGIPLTFLGPQILSSKRKDLFLRVLDVHRSLEPREQANRKKGKIYKSRDFSHSLCILEDLYFSLCQN